MSSPTRIVGFDDDFGSGSGSGGATLSHSEELNDLAQILRLMLIAENENAFKDANVETLEQMITMNDRDLIASFEMVSGVRPSSRVNVQQITEDYKKKKLKTYNNSSSSTTTTITANAASSSNIGGGGNDDSNDFIIDANDQDNNLFTNTPNLDERPIADESIEIIMDDSGVRIPEPPVLEVKGIPIEVQLKLRVLKLKVNDPELLKEYTDQQLTQVLQKYGNNVQSSADFILQNKVKKGVSFDTDSEDNGLVAIPQNSTEGEESKYTSFTKDVLRQKLKMGGFTDYEHADDQTLSILLDLGGGDVDCTMQNLRGTASVSTSITPKYFSDPNLPWDKNPTKPITEEAKEALQKEGRSVTIINQIPYDTLEHVFEYLGRKDVLVSSSVNQFFNKVSSSDYFWTTKQDKGKSGLIDNYEMERYNTFTKNQTHYGNWKLWRLDNLFFTKIKQPPFYATEKKEVTEESPIMELEDGRTPFKQKYAKYRKQKLIRERVDTIEKKIRETRINEKQNIDYEYGDHVYRSWVGFLVILAISAIIGLILVPLSMDEFIPNEIGTYYWLISWLSLGIITIPYFYIMTFHHANLYNFYPVWSKSQLSGEDKLDHGGEFFLIFSSTWTWLPYIFLVAGLKYAVYPELPILSYIAIPGYVLAMTSFFCSAPTLGATLKSSDKERVAFATSAFFYGVMLLSLQVFLILLFAKIDGLEYALNIPFSIVFIPGYVSLLCFPLGFFTTAFFAMCLGSDSFTGSILAASGYSFVVLLIISPLLITAPFVAAVLDSFILQSIFPFVAIFSITYGLGIIILCVIAAVVCFILCVCRDYD